MGKIGDELQVKKVLALLLAVAMLVGATACATNPQGEAAASKIPAQSAVVSPAPEPVTKTAVQAQPSRYVPLGEVGTYNTNIITDQILSDCTLPHLDKSALPYWTGFILENKISVNCAPADEWEQYTGGGWFYNEAEIRCLSENGFNCIRALYSLSFLSNPENVNEIDVSELEQLDELISWCAKYNMHLILSQTGLPGKWASYGENWHNDFDAWSQDENVGGNPELFTSSEMQATYLAYWDMLAKRYQNISNGILSFELAVEASVPDGDTKLQAQVLGPVANTIWSYTPDRIIIAPDVWSCPAKELAALGCCISLHEHIYSVGEMDFLDFPNTIQKWPMQYLPSTVDERSGTLSLSADNKFSAGELTLYFEYYNALPIVAVDGVVVQQSQGDEPVDQSDTLTIPFSDGTKQIDISFPQQAGLSGFVLKQSGKTVLTVPSHAVAQNLPCGEPLPALLVHDDFTLEDISKVKHPLDETYFTQNYLKPFLDCAAENNVSFLMTEIGTDSAAKMKPEDYVAYEATWLQALKDANVGWMFNCIHNIFAPEELMWMNRQNTLFTEYSSVPDMYGYSINDTVMNLLKQYR